MPSTTGHDMSHRRQQLIDVAKAYGQRIAPKKTYFRLLYVPEHANDLFHQLRDKKDEEEPLRARLPLNSLPKPRGLWWHTICGKQVSLRSTVRNHTRRRIRDAFRDALFHRGFDRHGLPVSSGKVQHPPREELVGSMIMNVNAPALDASPRQLHRNALLLVDSLMTATWAKKLRTIR